MTTPEFRYVTTNLYQPVYTVTNAVGNGTTITYTSNNKFSVGDLVTTSGLLPSQYNKTDAKIISRTSTSFTISSSSTGTFTQAGKATTFNKIISELPFTGVNFTQQLNSVGTFQGHVLLSGINSSQLNAYNGTIPGKTILWVLYTDPESSPAVSIPVWSGVIWAREYNSSSQTLSISAQEMMSLYNRRRISTTKNYTATTYDPAYIAYSLMDYAESLTNGSTGLTRNNVASSYLTQQSYEGYQLKSVYQAVKDLSQNYFDFAIKPYVDFTTGKLYNQFTIGTDLFPLGTTYSTTSLTAPVFQFPGNLISYSFPEDATSAANKLYGLGYGNNAQKIIVPLAYNDFIGFSATDPWPLLEDTANWGDIQGTSLVTNLTKGQLKATAYPPTTIQIVIPTYIDPIYPSYKIGDEVRLDILDDYFPNGISFGATNPLRVVAISVEPGENGPSRVTLTLTRNLLTGSIS